MMDICTTCDHKYVLKGLALHRSLSLTLGDQFMLHWLCLDEITYRELLRAKLPNVLLYNLSEIELRHAELRLAKNNPPSNYGTAWSQYCWTLTPWFINYLLTGITGIKKLLYADSDIFFYQSPQIIFEVMGNAAVAIHTHRFSGQKEDFTGDNGWYNVGVLAFSNTPTGINISETWKNWLLDTKNRFYKTHGTCGDQKYLELFAPLFGRENICVFDEVCADPTNRKVICHQAPWCTDSCGITPVLFYHFSHFVCDVYAGTWRDHINADPEWQPAQNPGIRPLYEQYFKEIMQASGLVGMN